MLDREKFQEVITIVSLQVDGDRDYGNEVGMEKVRGIQELFQKKKG